MSRWTERRNLFVGLGALIGASVVASQGCGDDDAECPGSKELCRGDCVDTDSDGANCGGCGNICGAGQKCVDGQCQCPVGQDLCQGVCVDITSDVANCGYCQKACKEFELCVDSNCQCPDGMAQCYGGCADTTSDKLNCGGCNIECPSAQSCVNSDCVCPDGTELCFSECVDTYSDANYCGNCSTNCDSDEHCNAGICETINGCDTVAMDQHEANDSCDLASILPEAAENAGTVMVNGSTLHHTDGSLDTDWYSIQTVEGFHACIPTTSQCYFYFNIFFTPPDPAAYATYELCVLGGSCSADEFCTQLADWNDSAQRYELPLQWTGVCGGEDGVLFYVKIARNGGEESCLQYGLEYEMGYTNESCP